MSADLNLVRGAIDPANTAALAALERIVQPHRSDKFFYGAYVKWLNADESSVAELLALLRDIQYQRGDDAYSVGLPDDTFRGLSDATLDWVFE